MKLKQGLRRRSYGSSGSPSSKFYIAWLKNLLCYMIHGSNIVSYYVTDGAQLSGTRGAVFGDFVTPK